MTEPNQPSYHRVDIKSDIAEEISLLPWDSHENTLTFRINDSLRRYLDLINQQPGLFKQTTSERKEIVSAR